MKKLALVSTLTIGVVMTFGLASRGVEGVGANEVTAVLATGCASTAACPAVLRLENGDFAIIGKQATNTYKDNLPEGTGCGPDEDIVVVPAAIFEEAVKNYTNSRGL